MLEALGHSTCLSLANEGVRHGTTHPLDNAALRLRGLRWPGTPVKTATSRKVLLLVDFINPMQFDGAEELAPAAIEAATATAALKRRYRREGWSTIYVNDNFGQWRSNFHKLLTECRRARGPARTLARLLAPDDDDLMVLKPRHSGFYATPLQLLLEQLGARELAITGLAADFCVKCTAMDAYVRGYRVWVPADCTAAESEERKRDALDWIALTLKARISPSTGGRRGA